MKSFAALAVCEGRWWADRGSREMVDYNKTVYAAHPNKVAEHNITLLLSCVISNSGTTNECVKDRQTKNCC